MFHACFGPYGTYNPAAAGAKPSGHGECASPASPSPQNPNSSPPGQERQREQEGKVTGETPFPQKALVQQRPVLAASLAAEDVRSERSSLQQGKLPAELARVPAPLSLPAAPPAVRLQPQVSVVTPPVPDLLAENQKCESEAGAGELSVSTD